MNGAGRQKRVMPSRSRRGGPGIGSTDVDLMILETQKRKRTSYSSFTPLHTHYPAVENEPLIPANTKFVLTTNSSLVPSSSSSSTSFKLELNSHAYERYFDRPEVLESYKAQQMIQTPEFSALTVDASVGGRFRPRIHEDVRPTHPKNSQIRMLKFDCIGYSRYFRRSLRKTPPQIRSL